VTLIGHSTGGGEITRYIGRHGTQRLAKAVLVSAVPPGLLKSKSNPSGTPLSVFDEIRAGVANDRSQYYKDFSVPFYGANRSGAKVSEGLREQFWLQCMQVDIHASFECIKAFSETDFSEDLKRFDIPTLIVRGDDDQIVPIASSALRTKELVKNSKIHIYQGAPHGLTATHRERFNADLLAFIHS
jgi:non-heme chloroperoxidase